MARFFKYIMPLGLIIISAVAVVIMVAVAKGKRPEIVDIVHQAMDGTAPDVSSLDKDLGDYVKTVKVIMGESLFSDSYLEI